jgi:uncharacterized protein YeaO (DUF488 family)
MKEEIKSNKKKRKRIQKFIEDKLKKEDLEKRAKETKKKLQEFSEKFKREDLSEKKLKQIVKELIREEAREEALTILLKSSDSQLKEFMYYYYEDIGNVCCLVLDSIKIKLVEQGEMKIYQNDYFGKPMWDEQNSKII